MNKISLGSLGRVFAIAALSFGGVASNAFGAFIAPNPLNPAGPTSTGAFQEQDCSPTGVPHACPTGGGTLAGDTDVFFDIVGVNGIANINVTGNVTPSTGGFYTFTYSVFNETLDPGHVTPISTGLPQSPPDFTVLAGDDYEIVMHWVLKATGAMASANWVLNVTTGPALATPEPGTLALLGLGLTGLGFASRRKKSS